MSDKKARYLIIFDPKPKTYTVVDRNDGQKVVVTMDPAYAQRYIELMNARAEREQQRLDALARAAGRPR